MMNGWMDGYVISRIFPESKFQSIIRKILARCGGFFMSVMQRERFRYIARMSLISNAAVTESRLSVVKKRHFRKTKK